MKVKVSRVISRYYRSGVPMAQVTVLRGEGSEQRSETRHVGRQNGAWIGNNPDPTAVSRNESANRILEQAEASVRTIESRIVDGEAALADVLTPEELTDLRAGDQAEGKKIVASILSSLRVRLAEARSSLTTAEGHRADVEANYPLRVEFTGGGL